MVRPRNDSLRGIKATDDGEEPDGEGRSDHVGEKQRSLENKNLGKEVIAVF